MFFYFSAFCTRRETVMPKISESEFEEVLQRNSSISSGAITRAVQDAAAGMYTVHLMYNNVCD